MAENEQNASENVVEMELHESMEKLWNATLNRIPQLQDTFRSRMINTLGKDGAKRIMNDVEVKRNLATLLAQSGSGIVQLVPGSQEDRSGPLLRMRNRWNKKAGEDNGQNIRYPSLEVRTLDGKEGPISLDELVSEPNSEAGRVLAWLYQHVIDDSKAYSDIFYSVTEENITQGRSLLQVQNILKEIWADTKNFDIGELGKQNRTPPPFVEPNSGFGKLKTAEEKLLQFQHYRKQPGRDTQRDAEKIAEAQAEIDDLENRQKRILDKLAHVNSHIGQLGIPKTWSKEEMVDISKNMGVAMDPSITNPTAMKKNVGWMGVSKSIAAWAQDETVKAKVERLEERKQESGYGRPRAEVALDQLLHRLFHTQVKNLTPEQREEYFDRLRNTLLANMKPIPGDKLTKLPELETSQGKPEARSIGSQVLNAGKMVFNAVKNTGYYALYIPGYYVLYIPGYYGLYIPIKWVLWDSWNKKLSEYKFKP